MLATPVVRSHITPTAASLLYYRNIFNNNNSMREQVAERDRAIELMKEKTKAYIQKLTNDHAEELALARASNTQPQVVRTVPYVRNSVELFRRFAVHDPSP
jgi:ABC-type antimicrobial peptide transport system ATPase subunit